MDMTETSALLTMIAAFDRRTIGDADVAAWQLVLADIRLPDAQQAVADHYRASRDFVMPADIRDGVSRLRRERVKAAPPEAELMVDVDYDDPAWPRILQARLAAIGDGTPPAEAITYITAAAAVNGRP